MDAKHRLSVPLTVAQVANKINQTLSKSLKEYDIAPEQRAILYMIDLQSDLSQHELSENLGKDKTTISRTLDVLEKKGYITREYSRYDKRVKIISLTKKGKEIVDSTMPTIQNFREAVVEGISKDEIEKFFKLIERISSNIDKYS